MELSNAETPSTLHVEFLRKTNGTAMLRWTSSAAFPVVAKSAIRFTIREVEIARVDAD
jgi:hypothetical protein